MKKSITCLLCGLLISAALFSQQGSSCANPYILTMDGVCRTYATSSTSNTAGLCSNPIYAGSSPVTFFSLTTNSTPDRVLLNITAPGGQPCEVLMYTTSNCTPPLGSSSMCFDDGEGLWAPSHMFVYAPNTTYKLRVKTAIAGNIVICAQHYTPPNDVCSGAFPIGPTPITDNNACHSPGPGVTPASLCAGSLENTAFYKYTVENTGVSIINFNNIKCDNGDEDNSNGLQVGFFTGTCGSLTPISCYSSSGSFISAATNSLNAGTIVYVAVDGVWGSNCQYEINGINAQPLIASLKYFSAWKNSGANMLKWVSLQEVQGCRYEVERSEDGNVFRSIGMVDGYAGLNPERNYGFEDRVPAEKVFYRLKMISPNGAISLSHIIEVKREAIKEIKIEMSNPIADRLQMQLFAAERGPMEIRVTNLMGVVIMQDRLDCIKGRNPYARSLGFLPPGRYFVSARQQGMQAVASFIKFHDGQSALVK